MPSSELHSIRSNNIRRLLDGHYGNWKTALYPRSVCEVARVQLVVRSLAEIPESANSLERFEWNRAYKVTRCCKMAKVAIYRTSRSSRTSSELKMPHVHLKLEFQTFEGTSDALYICHI